AGFNRTAVRSARRLLKGFMGDTPGAGQRRCAKEITAQNGLAGNPRPETVVWCLVDSMKRSPSADIERSDRRQARDKKPARPFIEVGDWPLDACDEDARQGTSN